MLKKNLFAFLTVTTLLAGSLASPAAAAEQQPVTASADAVSEADRERLNYIAISTELSIQDMLSTIYTGTWVETGYGFDLYLPKGWLFSELTAEQTAAGCIFDLTDETAAHHVTLSASSAEKQNGATLESLYTSMSEEAAQGLLSDCVIKTINGIHCITCTRAAADNSSAPSVEVDFFDAAGNLFTLRIGPADEGFRSAAYNILCSLSMTEVYTESRAE